MTDPPAAQKRILASQACDGCRLRKVRCKDGSPGSQCRRCVHLSLACTFDMPTSVRGPKRRKHTSSVSLQEISLNGRPAALLSPGSTASGEDGLLRPGSSTGDPPTSSISPTQTTGLSPNSPRYATDDLCPREIVLLMLDDYMNLLYPLIPVVHRPTFRRSIATNQDSHDSDFLGLIIAMCAVTVGNVPSRFETYRDHKPGYSLGSRKDFIHHAYSVLLSLRGPDYFDEISFQKFAIPYLFDIAFFQIGQVNRSRMIEAECLQLARMLGLHNITGYTGLNHIETQLRKKGFWLVFYSHVHHSVQSLLKERLTYLDPALLQQIDPEALMPLDVEDEAIFEDRVVPELSPQPNLTTGFNLANLVWWAAVESWGDPSTPGSARRPCTCSHFHDRRERAAHVQSRLQDLKYTLDAIPPELRQWALRPINQSSTTSPRDQEILSTQYGSIRANLHVTHIWLRSILLDQLDSLSAETCPATSPAHLATVESRWAERENLAAQLIHLLHGIAPRAVEPNALHFAYKVRDVAVGLLGCPFEERDPASVRAAGYVREFTQILSRLDASEVVMTTNLQTWVDTDREQGRRPR